MLDANATAQLRQYLQLLKLPIELVASLDDSPTAGRMRELLDEIAALSPLVTVREEPNEWTPSFAVRRAGADVAVRFAGLPMGHEFASLVLALVQVGGHPAKVDPETIAAIEALPGGEFVTFMSLTCQNCPTVVQALNTMSVLNPRIRHVAVEGSVFPAEVEARGIKAVPTVYRDGELFGQGRMDIADIVAQLDASSPARAAAALEAKAPFDMLIIGGGPAGAAAAVYAARKALRTGVVAERFGGQVLDTVGIENLVSVPYTEGPRLAASLEEHVRHYDVDITTSLQATSLHPADADGLLRVDFANGGSLRARSVVVATGARYRTLGVPGEKEYRNKGVTFCPHCDGPLFTGKRVAVIGGGNAGVEAAIDLAGIAQHVTVIEYLEELRADQVLIDKLHSLPNVEVRLASQVQCIEGDGTQVEGIEVEDRHTGQRQRVDVSGVFVQIGQLPNTEWLTDTVERNQAGEIRIDSHGATSLPGVYAAGDCTETPYKQIVVSLGAGATAALGAFDYLIRGSGASA